MSLLRPKIVDARGERLPLLAPLDRTWRRRRRELQRHVDSAEVWTRPKVAIMAVVMLPVVASGATIPAILYFKLPIWLVFAAIVPLGVLPAVSMVLVMRNLFGRTYRDALVKAGSCPSCGYDLSSTTELDGCRICPECGGMWGRGEAEFLSGDALPERTSVPSPPDAAALAAIGGGARRFSLPPRPDRPSARGRS